MGKFNRGGFREGRGGRSFDNKRGFNDRSPREMHKAICSKCGKECEVPFRPTGEKPVYCRDCFREMNGGESRRDDRNSPHPNVDNRPSGNSEYKDQFATLNTKMDRILSILENAVAPKEASTEKMKEPEGIEAEEPLESKTQEKKKRSSKKSL